MNCILLLGAGFSANWGGLVATELTNDLMSRVQENPQLLTMLNSKNFEDVLAQVQAEYLHSRSGESEKRLTLMQGALSDVFRQMNEHFTSHELEFSNDLAHSVRKFLVRFDAIFTLNQDLLLEVHYNNQDAGLWYGTRWQGYDLPGLREISDPRPLSSRAQSTWHPQEPFQLNVNRQPYFKLHGSTAWKTADGKSLLVVGRDKLGTIKRHPILHWNYQRFEEYLARPNTRLMVIGYGFGDEHINDSLIQAHENRTLTLMYLVHPRGRAILEKYPIGTIPGPQPLRDIPCIECTVPLSAAFGERVMAQKQMERIFGDTA
jgi:hypothetical protein